MFVKIFNNEQTKTTIHIFSNICSKLQQNQNYIGSEQKFPVFLGFFPFFVWSRSQTGNSQFLPYIFPSKFCSIKISGPGFSQNSRSPATLVNYNALLYSISIGANLLLEKKYIITYYFQSSKSEKSGRTIEINLARLVC